MLSQEAHLAPVYSLLQVPEGSVAVGPGHTVKSALISGAVEVLLLI